MGKNWKLDLRLVKIYEHVKQEFTMSFQSEVALRQELVEVCRLAYQRGYLNATEGNLSIRMEDGLILSTAAQTCKGRIKSSDLLLIDIDGKIVPSQYQSSGKKLSSELKMHLFAYRRRPDVKAIMHAHPATAVGFTVAGRSLASCTLPEVVCTLGTIPTAPYATPSTEEVPESIAPYVNDYDAILLDHHGAITLAPDIWEAFYKMETIEHFAKTMLVAEMLGGAKQIGSAQLSKLMDIRSVYGLSRPVKIKCD